MQFVKNATFDASQCFSHSVSSVFNNTIASDCVPYVPHSPGCLVTAQNVWLTVTLVLLNQTIITRLKRFKGRGGDSLHQQLSHLLSTVGWVHSTKRHTYNTMHRTQYNAMLWTTASAGGWSHFQIPRDEASCLFGYEKQIIDDDIGDNPD
jgi:hypothetical protein